jgi:hypothetical protein
VVSDDSGAIKLALCLQRVAVAVVEPALSDQARRRIDRGRIGGVAMTETEEQDEHATVTGDARITSGAERMRRSRERRRQGSVIVNLEIEQGAIAHFVALGWLPAPDCDKDALTHALIDLIERAIEVRVTPAPSSQGKVSFMLEIQHGTTDTLVNFGWLPADQRDDLSAIVKAFRRFAGRSLAVARNSGPDRWYIP